MVHRRVFFCQGVSVSKINCSELLDIESRAPLFSFISRGLRSTVNVEGSTVNVEGIRGVPLSMLRG